MTHYPVRFHPIKAASWRARCTDFSDGITRRSSEDIAGNSDRRLQNADALGLLSAVPPKNKETALEIHICWHYFYPTCSTTPWQLDGVIATLFEDGYQKDKLYGCHNHTVVVSARRGEIANKHWQVVVKKHGLRDIHLYDPSEEPVLTLRERTG